MRIRVKHALTMTMGTEWNESIPYSDPRNDERRMAVAADRYRFVLDRPLTTPPGERWNYNGGATAVIAALVARGTGRPLLDYAKERLFDPLGIEHLDWMSDNGREPSAAAGLRLRPRDVAKIGQLVLDGGRWGGPSGRARRVAEGIRGAPDRRGAARSLRVLLVARRGERR